MEDAIYEWADRADRALVYANAGVAALLRAWMQCPPYLDEPEHCLAYVAAHAPRALCGQSINATREMSSK